MKKILLLLSSLIALTLGGCASTFHNNPEKFTDYGMPLGTHALQWQDRQHQLMTIRSWSARGNVAARSNKKGWNASFNWHQTNGNYALELFGPLGMNRMQLTGQPGQVTLKTSRGVTSAASPEALLQQQLGWQLPVSDLRFWLRGLPAPYSREKHSFDLNHHLAHLYQDGWRIVYLRYVSVNGVDLPNRLLLTNANWTVHIVITHWNLH
jgi:outer membrane lipoprotein LolB